MLPQPSDLNPRLVSFLDDYLLSRDGDLPSLCRDLCHLSQQLNEDYASLKAHLSSLDATLNTLIASWVSRSLRAKAALEVLNRELRSSGWFVSKEMEIVVDKDLFSLCKEVKRISNIRNYIETVLKLEALVGDVEDVVFHFRKQYFGSISSATLSRVSNSTDIGLEHVYWFQAVNAMKDIENVLVHVTKFNPQWSQLMKSVDTRVDTSFAALRAEVFADHRALLASIGWPPKLLSSKAENGISLDLPNPFVLIQADQRKRYEESFILLCSMQHIQMQRKERHNNLSRDKNVRSFGLWAIDQLVSPIASRMEYYFSRWENQPELMFALVSKIACGFIQVVEDVLQPLIDKARFGSCSAKEFWISAIVQMLSGYLVKNNFSSFAEKYKEKDVRSEVATSWRHLVDLMVALDRQMQSLVDTVTCTLPGGPERYDEYPRIISVFAIFCEKSEWLKTWGKMELKNAWKKLKVEMEDENAWLIDTEAGVRCPMDIASSGYLLYSREDHKAPLIAELAVKMAWKLIERGME